MKNYSFIGILLILLSSSCSVKKLTRQYLANDDVCFCGLDSTLLKDEMQYNTSVLNFEKAKPMVADTIVNSNDVLKIWGYVPTKGFTIYLTNKNTNIKTGWDYSAKGSLESKSSSLVAKETGYAPIGNSFCINAHGNYLWHNNNNYIITSVGYDTINTIAQKYPICWKEALNIVEAKIGKYELLRLYRHADKEPNYKEMNYYWTVKTKKRWEKPKYYFVDAVTGRVERAIIIVTLGTDDML